MKKKIALWIAIVAGLIAAIGIFNVSRGRWILASQVQRVEFRGYSSCDGPEADKVELTDSEIRTLVSHYNLAAYAGEINAEGCVSDFGFVIYLTDGSKITAREAQFFKIDVTLPTGTSYWLKSEGLTRYAQELIEKYDLNVS